MVEVLGGTSFSQSIFSLRILLLSLPIFFPSALFVWLLVTLHKEKFLFPIYLLGAIFNIVANILYIPKYGFLASAVITGITEVIVISGTVTLGVIFLRRKERYA
jgi:O-antigen/teichoic acid export membrane protein